MTLGWLELSDEELLAQCEQRFIRSGGPGGQKRNKTSSGVELLHQPTGVSARATESRRQIENRARALKRLRMAIAIENRTHLDLATYTLPELVKARRDRSGRVSIGARDRLYPALAAHLLDLLLACEGRLGDAARLLEVSTANLTKLLKLNGKVQAAASRLREQFGLGPIR